MPRRSARKRGWRARLQRWRRTSARSTWVGPIALALVSLMVSPWLACVSSPPDDPDDICSIFRERRGWLRSATATSERWGVPESVQLAIIHQESSFRATARPPRRSLLWVLPGPRPSTAYGYGQVLDSTWRRYQHATGRSDASRDDFADVTDFIGWYADGIHRRTGISKHDARELYAAYHEGPGGYARGSHRAKPWLSGVSNRVARRAVRYQAQLDGCREDLARKRFLGLF